MSAATSGSTLEVDIPEDAFCPVYIPYLDYQGRYLHLYGGGGSGKSEFAGAMLLLRMLEEPGHKFLMLRKVGKTIRKSQFALVKKLIERWDMSDVFRVKETEMEVHCRDTGGSIVSSGLDNPEKLKSIDGITGIWIEEATELTEDEFTQVDLRLRFPGLRNQIILTYNPINVYHWIRTKIHTLPYRVASDGRGHITQHAAILKTTYRDNPFSDRAYIDTVLSNLTEGFWKTVYKDGDWGAPEHVIFKNWRSVDNPPAEGEPVYGLDFGYEVPTALVQLNFSGRRKVSVRELLYETHLTNGKLIDLLRKLIPNPHSFIYADHDMQRIQEIEEAGFNIYPADKAVQAGIDFVRRFELEIDSESANLLKELPMYQNKIDRNSKAIDDPVKINDHLIDATRYGVYTHGKEWFPETELEALPVIPSGGDTRTSNISPLVRTF